MIIEFILKNCLILADSEFNLICLAAKFSLKISLFEGWHTR